MITLFDKETERPIGSVSNEELEFLTGELEEESAKDTDYYVDASTIEMLEEDGAPASLVTLLRDALGSREGFEIQWTRS